MKKIIKLICKICFISGVLAFINKTIYKYSDLSKLKNKSDELYYEYIFGKIKYNVSGNSEKSLLLIHGLGIGCGSHEYENSIKSLAKKYKVYSIDLLGFGVSDKPNISYNSYLYVNLINKFITNIIKNPVYAIGSSNSADFLTMAAKMSPENFEKLILINPNGINCNKFYNTMKNHFTKKILFLPILGTFFYNIMSSKIFIYYFLCKYCYKNFLKVSFNEVNKYYNASHFFGHENKYPISYFASNFLNVDTTKVLIKTNLKTLIIFGEENAFVEVFWNKETLSENLNVSVIIVPFTKLLPHVEKPELFIKSVCEFFG